MATRTNLPADEREDFETLARGGGIDPAKFEIEVMQNIPPEPGVIYRNIDIAYGENVRASYDGSSGTSWLADFERDLKSGRFK